MKKNFLTNSIKFLSLLLFLVMMSTSVSFASDDDEDEIEFLVGFDDPDPIIPPFGKGPVSVPSASLNGHQITFLSSHDDFTLSIVENGVTTYTTYVAAETQTVILPSSLQGNCVIMLVPDSGGYYFYGFITL